MHEDEVMQERKKEVEGVGKKGWSGRNGEGWGFKDVYETAYSYGLHA